MKFEGSKLWLLALLLALPLATHAAQPVVTSVSPAEGTTFGGQTVIITGSNFNTPAVTAVSFGATPAASFTIISDTKIQAVTGIPATDGSVSVDATNASGTNAPNLFYLYKDDNPAIQVVAKVTLAKHAGIQWGAGTTVDDAGVDHTAGAARITPYVWIVRDAVGGASLDLNSTYASDDAANAKTINLNNTSLSNSILTLTALVLPSMSWTPAAAPGLDQFQVRAKLGAGAFVPLSGTPANLDNNFSKALDKAVVVEVRTPTQISAASISVQQEMVLVFTALAN